MNNKGITYEVIQDSINFSFEEYIEEDGFTVSQATAKIMEEDWRKLNLNQFTKTAYYVGIAIACLRLEEIPDYIYSELDRYLQVEKFEDCINEDDILELINDISLCKQLLKENKYKVVETDFNTKMRIEYLLTLQSQ